MRVSELVKFIVARYDIFEKRKFGIPPPWTTDRILQTYRFCNVHREEDTCTKWFAEAWRRENAGHVDLWFNSLVYRFINWPPTAKEIGYTYSRWRPDWFLDAIHDREARGEKVYNAAYMVSTHSVREKKSVYLAKSLTKIWGNRESIRYVPWEGLHSFHSRLMGQFDVGSFIAAQVVADCKYAGAPALAEDWHTFAASGPGSKRGLNRVCGNDVKNMWKEDVWHTTLLRLREEVNPLLVKAGVPVLHAQDLQNCLCEFDKYERVRLGQGVPKQLYRGGR